MTEITATEFQLPRPSIELYEMFMTTKHRDLDWFAAEHGWHAQVELIKKAIAQEQKNEQFSITRRQAKLHSSKYKQETILMATLLNNHSARSFSHRTGIPEMQLSRYINGRARFTFEDVLTIRECINPAFLTGDDLAAYLKEIKSMRMLPVHKEILAKQVEVTTPISSPTKSEEVTESTWNLDNLDTPVIDTPELEELI